jgi:hypothetical protein
VNLGKVGLREHTQYLARTLPDGTIVLEPAVVMSQAQAALLTRPDILDAISSIPPSEQRIRNRPRPEGMPSKEDLAGVDWTTLPPENPERTSTAPAQRRVRKTGQTSSTRADMAVIRAWAKAHGFKVSGRGKIPAAVMKAYALENLELQEA